ncbi:MAG: glycosyltransferase family 2 protein [Propionibacteriaceae bacterium]|nr:glycosyltransferase family 2 protein [Micropruina sp.]
MSFTRDLPSVSVVIPAWDVAAYLPRCLDALLNQDHSPIEIIVIDDGSSDATPAILADYAARHPEIVARRQENAGPGPARNAGAALATGDYLIFVDADDYVEPDYLARLVTAAAASGAEVTVCGFSFDLGRVRLPYPMLGLPRTLPGPRASRLTVETLPLPPFAWTKLYRREWFISQGFAFPPIFYEDIGSTASILYRAETVAIVRRSLYHYCLRDSGITGDFGVRNVQDYVAAAARQRDFLVGESLWPAWRGAFRWFTLVARVQVGFQILFLDTHIRRRDRLRLFGLFSRELVALGGVRPEAPSNPGALVQVENFPFRERRKDLRAARTR